MARPPARSDVYRLIAAGRRAHAAVLAPLAATGLLPGDDVVVLELGEGPQPIEAIAASAGVPWPTIAPHVARLAARGVIARGADGAYGLTAEGAELCRRLLDAWAREERALAGHLKRRQRRGLRRALGRYLRE